MRRLTHEQVAKKVKKLHPRIRLLTEYVNTRTHIGIECLDCGHRESKYANNLINNNMGCSACANANHPAHQPTPAKELKRRMLAATNYKILSGSIVDGGRGFVEVQCRVCGWKGRVQPFTFSAARGMHYMYCCKGAACVENSSLQGGNKKTVLLAGKVHRVRGYEPLAIEYITGVKRVAESGIVTDGQLIPTITYTYKRVSKRHKPDIYVPSKNILVEVKSTYTAGLLRNSDREKFCWETLCKKSLAAKAEGYKYIVLLMTVKGGRLVLPKNWEVMSHAKARRWYAESSGG